MADLQAIASQIGIAPKNKPRPPEEYERKKKREAERQRQKSRTSREISNTCPPCKDPKIREKIRKSLKFALTTLFAKRFYLDFSKDQLELIKDIEETIRSGGQLARAMPRATGKTSILICAVIWAILTGLHPFVVLIGATGEAAKELLEQIRSELETNEAIYQYFPELVHPIRRLEGISQRRLLWNGEPIKQVWKKARIVLPNRPQVPGAGSIIAVAGLDGRIRGMSYQRTDGANVRPSLVLIDDPQTRKSAASLVQTNKREQVINGDVLGLAGPGVRISALVACTVIHPGDLSDRMLDREKHPEWQGKRTRLLKSLPTNLNQWDEYAEILRADLRADKGRTRATNYYKKRRRKMDVGAIPAWPSRFDPGQISAIQYAMDIRILNRESFEAEYQNDPIRTQDESAKLITADELLTRMNQLARGRVPLKAQHLTAAIDVQGDLLYWMICWWTDDFTGGILDYGESPDQKRNYFALSEVSPTLIQATGRKAKMAAVRAGLDSLVNDLMTRQFVRDDGAPMKIEKLCIDANWGESTDTVFDACRESPHAQLLRPTHGKGFKVTERPMVQWKAAAGETSGFHWFRRTGRRGIRYLMVDVNFWKTFVHNGLNLMPEEKHSISLFAAPPHEHRMLADHLTSETRQRPRTEDNRTVDLWSLKPGAENHRFDTFVLCAVGASEIGVTLSDAERTKRPKRTIKATYL